MLRNIIFDFDGALFDTKEVVIFCLNFTLEKIGKEELKTKVKKQLIGPPLWEIFKTLLPLENDNFTENCVKIFRSEYEKKGTQLVSLISGMPELLRDLKKNGKQLFIVSNKPKSFITKILASFELNIFDSIEAPEIKISRYNKINLLTSLMAKRKISIKETLMIGDRSDDIIAAKKNKIIAIGVTYGYGSKKELKEAGADKLFNSAKALGKYLLKND